MAFRKFGVPIEFDGGSLIYSGTDSPEGVQDAPAGSLYLQTTTSSKSVLWIKGTASEVLTGWFQLSDVAYSGSYLDLDDVPTEFTPSEHSLYDHIDVGGSAPEVGSFLRYTQATFGADKWEAKFLTASDIPSLPISKITGLQTALDGKASSSHALLSHSDVYLVNPDPVPGQIPIYQAATGGMFGQPAGYYLRTLTSADLPSLSISKITGLQTALDNKLEGSDLIEGSNITIADNGDGTFTISSSGSGSGGASALEDLTDVDLTSVSSGEFLRYDGSNWVNTSLIESDIPSLSISKITSLQSKLDDKQNVGDAVLLPTGSNSSPSLTFEDDTDTGIYSGGSNSDVLLFSVGGEADWYLSESAGNVTLNGVGSVNITGGSFVYTTPSGIASNNFRIVNGFNGQNVLSISTLNGTSIVSFTANTLSLGTSVGTTSGHGIFETSTDEFHIRTANIVSVIRGSWEYTDSLYGKLAFFGEDPILKPVATNVEELAEALDSLGLVNCSSFTVTPMPTIVDTKVFTILSPVSGNRIMMDRPDTDLTIRRVTGVVTGSSSPSVSVTLRRDTDYSQSGTVILNSHNVSSTTTGNSTTTFSNSTVPADNFLWCEIGTVSGTVESLSLIVEYEAS